jgi:hypothetical protein
MPKRPAYGAKEILLAILQRYRVWRFLIRADEKARRNAMGYGNDKV